MGDDTQLLRNDSALYPEDDDGYMGSDTERPDDNLRVSIQSTNTGITWYKATFLIVNAALGAGILNFPFAFNETGGIVSGNVAHIIFFSFATVSLIIFAFCGTQKHCNTYQEVVTRICGPKWGIVCSLCITLYCFVTCITFIIIIGDQFDRAFASYIGLDFCHHWYLNRKFTMVVSSLLLIFPSCLKRIDGMEFMSYVGVISVIYLVVVILVELFIGNYIKGEIHILDVNLLKFFNAVPTISFGYQCHVSSVPIISCLKRREKSEILKACLSAMFICFLVYTVSANSGYLTFGSLVSSDVLLDYDAKQVYVLIAVLLLGLKSWTTYPILLFCVREAIADIYLEIRNLDGLEAARSEPRRRKIIAVLVWVATIVFGVFIPGLNIVIKLLGSLASVFILIFPGLCYMNLTLEKGSRYDRKSRLRLCLTIILATMYMVVGSFTLGLAFTLGVESFMNPAEDKPICEISRHIDLFYGE